MKVHLCHQKSSYVHTLLVISLSILQEQLFRLLEGNSKLIFGGLLPFVLYSPEMIPHCYSNMWLVDDSVSLCIFLSRYAFTARQCIWDHCHAEK